MKAEIVDRPDGQPDITVDAIPIHGVDFCDRCGDCLDCYCEAGYHPCPNGHLWVVYADLSPERAAALLEMDRKRADDEQRGTR